MDESQSQEPRSIAGTEAQGLVFEEENLEMVLTAGHKQTYSESACVSAEWIPFGEHDRLFLG